MRLVMTLATALLALGLGACFEPHFDNMGGFKCPCGKGWYCDKVGGEGKCFQGVRPDWPPATKKDTGSTKPPDKGSTTKKDTGSTTKKDTGSTKPPDKGNTTKQDKGVKPPLDKGAPPKKDQGTPPQLDKGPDMPGTTTNKCKLTAFKPVPYSSDFNHDFDFRLVPLKKHHLASWGVGANTSAKMFWGYLLPSGQWSVSSVAAAKDGGDETAIVGNTATGTKYHEVIFYASKITTKTKIRALPGGGAGGQGRAVLGGLSDQLKQRAPGALRCRGRGGPDQGDRQPSGRQGACAPEDHLASHELRPPPVFASRQQPAASAGPLLHQPQPYPPQRLLHWQQGLGASVPGRQGVQEAQRDDRVGHLLQHPGACLHRT